jgi:hypothetical protein
MKSKKGGLVSEKSIDTKLFVIVKGLAVMIGLIARSKFAAGGFTLVDLSVI